MYLLRSLIPPMLLAMEPKVRVPQAHWAVRIQSNALKVLLDSLEQSVDTAPTGVILPTVVKVALAAAVEPAAKVELAPLAALVEPAATQVKVHLALLSFKVQ